MPENRHAPLARAKEHRLDESEKSKAIGSTVGTAKQNEEAPAMMILQPCSNNVLLATILLLMSSLGIMSRAEGASAPVAPSRELQVFTSADESSPVIELVTDGRSLSPIAEMIGVGGLKWFMVKTGAGNVGWIKAANNLGAAKMDDHFRALPKDSTVVGPISSVPEPASTTGAITIPVKIDRAKVVVPVTFQNGNSSSTGYLAVDTGASQTMISKRIARDLRLLSMGSQQRIGIGGAVIVDVGRVEAVRVGSAEVKNMHVSIHDRMIELGYEGLLGFDFLGRFQMSVDAEKQVMVLTPRAK
jgi:predicted aspartyl protease